MIDHTDLGLFLGSLFCSIGLCVCSYASTRLFWLQWSCNTVWFQVLVPSYFVVLSQNCCSYSESLMVPYKFLKCLFYICEIHHWYFNKDCVKSINCFGWYGHLDDINYSNPWTWYRFPFICVFLNFFLQCSLVFCIQVFHLLG